MSDAYPSAAPIFDKQDQLDKIQAGLLAGETVLAVYDGKGGGTGFIGLTDRRLVLEVVPVAVELRGGGPVVSELRRA